VYVARWQIELPKQVLALVSLDEYIFMACVLPILIIPILLRLHCAYGIGTLLKEVPLMAANIGTL
jgi:hypothetical protein